MNKIISHFFSTVNNTENPALTTAFEEYQAVYLEVRNCRQKADATLKAIHASINSLVSFILEDLGKSRIRFSTTHSP